MIQAASQNSPEEALDPCICRRARLSRDSRFDGEFFLAVRTTGIYCRPICPARPPAEKNVVYFRHAAQAADSGYRPCLRCRPESSPDSPAWRGSSTTVVRALSLIRNGALNEGSVEHLAERLGVGERYLRKLFAREVGVSPLAVAQNQRLLFAKKLLLETALPVTEVAFAAGYSSVRRFNAVVRDNFGTTPGELRRKQRGKVNGPGIKLQLHYRPPYDWAGVMNFFGRHAIEGLELVTPDSYQRTIAINGDTGRIRVTPVSGQNALQLELHLADHRQLMPTVARVRQVFDLDASPSIIGEALGSDPVLAPLVEKFPGIRTPVHWSLYEATLRAIVGQQVSTQAARQVCGRLTVAATPNSHPLCFPEPAMIARLEDSEFPMPGRRRETLREVSRQCALCQSTLALDSLAKLKGIGPWTTNLVAMRGYGDPDVFPPGDLGLVRAFEALSTGDQSLANHCDNWRPWRSYAANLLWRSITV
ncbi:MAG: DNA-3-methyladenine glycosylase 2 family protein [Halieaceae bacterium]|jgi:AraC family transcriptional regulator, regulatory protein of adaptative response / DNA-3-methyladenine glycosylase II|nr:DNA-3-methyladenine glycosylase 2 family protein [Halieaceae bacterium]